MKISLSNIYKRFGNEWLFKDVNYLFESGSVYALLGANGSGKSTLLRIIASLQNPSKGKVSYIDNHKEIKEDKIFPHISFCAPGLELIEEFTLKEMLEFHFSFKSITDKWSIEGIISCLGLGDFTDKYLYEFSSGMKQRVKLAQAFFSDTSILLLDEPCTNLDLNGITMYLKLLKDLSFNKIVIIASNDEREYSMANHKIKLEEFIQ